jgi:hypothetical protein
MGTISSNVRIYNFRLCLWFQFVVVKFLKDHQVNYHNSAFFYATVFVSCYALYGLSQNGEERTYWMCSEYAGIDNVHRDIDRASAVIHHITIISKI